MVTAIHNGSPCKPGSSFYIPDETINEAQRLSNQKNRTAVIIKALEEYTRTLKREKLLSLRGKKMLADDFDVDKMRSGEIDEMHIGY